MDTFASNLHDSWGAYALHDSPPIAERGALGEPPRLSTESARSATSQASKASSGEHTSSISFPSLVSCSLPFVSSLLFFCCSFLFLSLFFPLLSLHSGSNLALYPQTRLASPQVVLFPIPITPPSPSRGPSRWDFRGGCWGVKLEFAVIAHLLQWL